ncbi:hypothetical protein M0R72_22010 [Candidatus Pacearchaeota archaeon]|jgi:hypothetical protein|nr:hypothetical protein [Candidatus Pacearchaeota archaeon]
MTDYKPRKIVITIDCGEMDLIAFEQMLRNMEEQGVWIPGPEKTTAVARFDAHYEMVPI